MAVWQQITRSVNPFIATILIKAIHGYRFVFGFILGGQCRYYPSCSHYMEQAIIEYGVAKGLGLGLFYVQQVIKAYNGTITVNSIEGNGAEFILSIPKP